MQEEVRSRFSSAGHKPRPPQVVNVSGAVSPNTKLAPRDDRGVRLDVNPPGWATKRQRTGTELDATTGQRLTDQVESALARAAASPNAVEPYTMSRAQVAEAYQPTPAEVHSYKRSVVHGAVTATPGVHEPAGRLGDLIVGSPAPYLAHLFRIGPGDGAPRGGV